MTNFLETGFDEKVLRLTEPVGLKPNTRVRLTLEVGESVAEVPKTLLYARDSSLTALLSSPKT